uniref:Temporin-1La n=1 Tax=Rana luteiventris TaxID=58176 RepID=TP1A_RANLU|nr:RecName: Full=Temporin-1La [Rana luteiventris]
VLPLISMALGKLL